MKNEGDKGSEGRKENEEKLQQVRWLRFLLVKQFG